MRTQDGGDIAADAAYLNAASSPTYRVNPDESTTPVVVVSATSAKYGVRYTWTMLKSVWDADGGPPAIALKTEQVNAVCAADHVQDFRTETDQGPSQQLFHYAVITVGTDDRLLEDEARVRMDQLGSPATFAAIEAVWARLVKVGAV